MPTLEGFRLRHTKLEAVKKNIFITTMTGNQRFLGVDRNYYAPEMGK